MLMRQCGYKIRKRTSIHVIRLPKRTAVTHLARCRCSLLAYHGVCEGTDVDKPRNLAKSGSGW